MTNTLKKHLIALIILLGIDLILVAFLSFCYNSTERRMLPVFVLISLILFCFFDLFFLLKSKTVISSGVVGTRILFLIFSTIGIIVLIIKAFTEIFFLVPIIFLLPILIILIICILWEYAL